MCLPRFAALTRLLFCLMLLASMPALAQSRADAEGDTDPTVVEVYLLSGQSNMAGSGQINQLPEEWRQPIDGAMYFNGKAYEVLTPGQTKLNGPQRFGPELAFARAVRQANPERPTYIIKFALSGQPLHAGFDGANWRGAEPGPGRKTFYPGTGPEDPNLGKHYQALMRHAQAGFAALREQGLEPRLAGVVWMQGEADAKEEVSATQYARSLKLLKTRIEQDLDSPPVPFVFGQVLPHHPALARFTHRTECRQSMANADQDSGHADAIPGCIMVPTENMPLLDDTVHYTTDGLIKLGWAFGKAMVQARARPQTQ